MRVCKIKGRMCPLHLCGMVCRVNVSFCDELSGLWPAFCLCLTGCPYEELLWRAEGIQRQSSALTQLPLSSSLRHPCRQRVGDIQAFK